MFKFIVYKFAGIYSLFFIFLLIACEQKMEGKPVNLEPNDPRQIYSIQAADSDEVDLLVQELGIEVVRVEGSRVFFFEDAEQLSRLDEFGYELQKKNSYDVFRRVVRIDLSIPEDELVSNGLRVINREKDYFVIEGTIGQLKALRRSGSQIVAVSGHEPRPRQIRIVVESLDDVKKVGSLAVDIYSANHERSKLAKSSRDNGQGGVVIYGGAFDYQIDQLKELGYSVEILPHPTSN